MPATTPKYGFPYPLGTDPIRDGDDVIQALAEQVEAAMGARVAYLDDQPGIPADVAVECGTAVQAAITAAEAAGITLVAGNRTYISNTTLTFKKHADFNAAIIDYRGATGTAVVIGDTVNGITRQVIQIGRIVNGSKVVGSFTEVAGSIGVDIADANKCFIRIRSVTKFETGVRFYGHARGTTYNHVSIGELASNKVNMRFATGTAAGYTNGNQVYGGSWNHDQTECGGTNVAGTRHVVMTSASPGPVADTNAFFGCSFEGNVAEFFIESYGKMNEFTSCRWEATTPKVWWRTGSYANAIRGGYKPELITITDDGQDRNIVTWPGSGDIDQLVVLPQQMTNIAGTTTAANIQRRPVVKFAASGGVGFGVVFPANWHTYDIEVHTLHDNVATGTASWLWRIVFEANGDILANPAGGISKTATAVGAQYEKQTVTFATGQPVTAGKTAQVNFFRDSPGTLAGDCGVTKVVLRRRS